MAVSEALGEAFVEIRAKIDSLEKDLLGVQKTTEDKVSGIGKSASMKLSASLKTGLAAGFAALGTSAVAAGLEMEEALHTIRAGTGATGKELEALGQSFRTVWKGGAEGPEAVSQALTSLKSLTGATGPQLEGLTRTYLDLADVAKTDVNPLVTESSRLFNKWGIEVDAQTGKLDAFLKISQATTIPIQQLIDETSRFTPAFNAMGFSIEESATLLGHWHQQGINSAQMLSGMQIAARKFSEDGVSLKDGLAAVVPEILRFGDSAEGTKLAMETFGRSGLQARDAILQGAFSVGELTTKLAASNETIAAADAATESVSEKFGVLKNRFMEILAPVGNAVISFGELGPMIGGIAMGMSGLTPWFVKLGPLLLGLVPSMSALGVALNVMLGPVGAVTLAVGAAYLAWKNWDKITAIVQSVYNAIKTYMLDKFTAIVSGIKTKIDAVVGYFKGMYDAVVGHSWVPDMMEGIGSEFGRLGSIMVDPTMKASDRVKSIFETMSSAVSGMISNLISNISGKLTGWLGKFMPSWASEALGGLATSAMQSITGGLLKKIGGGFLGKILGGAGGGGGGILGGIFGGGGGGGMLGGLFGGGGAAAGGAGGAAGGLGALGPLLTNPITGIAAGAGALVYGIVKKGLFRGGEEHMKVNKPREQFISSLGTGAEASTKDGAWNQLNERLFALTGNTNLMQALAKADTERDFIAARDAITARLKETGTTPPSEVTGTAASGEQTRLMQESVGISHSILESLLRTEEHLGGIRDLTIAPKFEGMLANEARGFLRDDLLPLMFQVLRDHGGLRQELAGLVTEAPA